MNIYPRRASAFGVLPLLLILASTAEAQLQRQIPSQRYFNAFGLLYEGDYRDALDIYQDEGRSGIKTAQSRWIDSICYHTMTGECYYQMGNLAAALEHFTQALTLYAAFGDWMIRVQFPPGIQPATLGARPAVPWGATKRTSRVGQFPDSYLMGQGRINNNDAVQKGGVVQQAQLFPVNVKEIVRATCLAIRRRRELLGPTCKYDPVTTQVVAALSRRPAPPNHWSQAWIDVQLGAAQASMGNPQQAASLLEHGILAAGEFDHPLTSTALLELGRLALEAGDFRSAARLFEETTYSAVSFTDLGILEEALRLGTMTHLVSGAKGPYPPLVPAVAWARQKGYRQLQASAATLAAESFATLGDTKAAAAMMNESRNAIGRRDMAGGAVGARANFTSAMIAFQQGNLTAGDGFLGAVWKYQQNGSFWLFHIGLVDRAAIARTLDSDRISLQLYESVLRDPTPADWLSSPMESITVLTTPHPLPYEHWFETAIRKTQDRELAVEIADRARRHRFFSTLPLGGRLMALRWILEGPDELLDQQQKLQRQELVARYPNLGELSLKIRQLHDELAQLPPVAEAEEDLSKQSALLDAIGKAGAAQELILREVALRRDPADMLFPPLRKTKDIQRALSPGRLLLSFFTTTRGAYGFLFSNEKYAVWPITSTAQIRKQLPLLLRDLGNYELNHQLGEAELNGDSWKKNAAKLRDLIFAKSNVDLNFSIRELTIVPDGLFWYVPWETLPVGDAETPLIARSRIRYAPTVGLAQPYSSRPLAARNVGVVLGKLYPQDKPEVSLSAFEQFKQSVPAALPLAEIPPAPTGLYRRAFDQLAVFDDIDSANGVYDWSPTQLDRGKPGGSLGAWLTLPWGGPDVVMIPGFHTAAENSIKPKKGVADGSDLFLPIMGLMSSGVRTVLIGRWRTGGQTSYDLVREFAQELPHETPAEAWQRSVLLAQDTPVDPELEPRVKRFSATNSEPPKARHPFFWSGYILADMGPPTEPKVPNAAEQPAAKAPPAGEAK
jgi:tetratricopeptide (TPR) repeat protein